jgi:uncharacterized membrane protein YjjB (DUF3815 family)
MRVWGIILIALGVLPWACLFGALAWVHHQYTVGFNLNSSGTVVFAALLVASAICLLAGMLLLFRSAPNAK